MNIEKINNKFDLIFEKTKKGLKEFFCVPFFGLFWIGTGIAMLGWIGVELITGEKIKEIKIVKT
jgi:hypothetical protein